MYRDYRSYGFISLALSGLQFLETPFSMALEHVVAPIYDIITPLNVPNGAAANATVKLYDIDHSDRQTVIQEIQLLKSYLVVQSLPAMEC